MLDLKEIYEFLDGQACLADQRPQSSLGEFRSSFCVVALKIIKRDRRSSRCSILS